MAKSAALKPQGRPSSYTQSVADDICERIASIPRGLDFICSSDEALPSARTVNRWLAENESFRLTYLRARERQADLIFDECLTIVDTPLIGVETINKADGTTETREGDMLGHRKLQVDTRMRMAGKLAPKKYGDKVALVGGDKDDAPIRHEHSDLDRAKAVAALIAKANG